MYAHHGCLEEEGLIGSDYMVNLEVKSDLTEATKSDSLVDTIDYVELQTIVTEEMAIRSKLLEHVAQRIINAVFLKIEMAKAVEVSVSKINPPIGGDVAEVRVTMKSQR